MKLTEPELLRVLIAFAESKNLVSAAERLRISQPAVTQRLQRLQEQLPLPLYAFEGRKKVLTHYGQALYQLARENMFHLENGLENIHRRYASGTDLVLRLGCRKEMVEIFSQTIQFPGRIEHLPMEDSTALSELNKETIDVAITETVVHSSDLLSRKIFEGSSRLIFHKKIFPSVESFREIQKQKNLLLEKPCVLHKRDSSCLERLAQALKFDASQLSCKAALEDWSSLVSLVQQGVGYAIVPPFVLSHDKNLVTFDIPHSLIPRTTYHATFHRKLKKIEAFNKALNFTIVSS
jgi:DNA-binding transcriptional LysR family regulator